jgi:signal transduction histidine kinase
MQAGRRRACPTRQRDVGLSRGRAPSFPTRLSLAEDRHEQPSEGARTRARARRGRAVVAERAPDLDLQYDLAEVLSTAQDAPQLVPSILKLLVGRLGFAAAELSIEGVDGAEESRVGHWLVRSVDGSATSPDSTASPEGGRGRENGHAATRTGESTARPTDLHCSLEQSFQINGGARALLCVYSNAPSALDLATQRFLRSAGLQIARCCEARPQLRADRAGADRGRRFDAYQERLRTLTAELLLAEERERRQLALDLHDGLSQTIALMRMRVAALALGANSEQTAALREIGELIAQANHAARSVSFELSPPVLHDLGLEPALEWLVENLSARYGLKIDFDHDERPKPTDEKTRVILFRSIRELLINAAKHARARVVRVTLQRVGDELLASVDDDGVGMEPALEQVQGSGLFSIGERLHHVGGDMSIQSERGQGTSVKLRAHIANHVELAPVPRFDGGAQHIACGTGLGTNLGERS